MDTIEIQLWRYKTPTSNTFTISVPKSARLEDLQPQIKAKFSAAFKDCDAVDICLYGIPDVSNSELISALSNWSPKESDALLLRSLVGEHAHKIIIAVRPEDSCHAGKKRPLEPEKQDLLQQLKRSKLPTEPPSQVSAASYYRTWHADPLNLFVDHRHAPEHAFGPTLTQLPPASLLYEGFGHFLDILDGCQDVPGMEAISFASLRSAVDAFAQGMSGVYPNETARKLKGLDDLAMIFGARKDGQSFDLMSGSISTKSISDGHINGPHGIAYCITEFKNEDATGTCIPYVEMASLFAHSVRGAMERNSTAAAVANGWVVPCLGLTIIGSCVKFWAMTALYEIQVVGLTPALSCLQPSGEGRDRIILYKAFAATSVLLARIKEDARKHTLQFPAEILYRNRFFPVISSLPHPHTNSAPISFTISDAYPIMAPERCLYIARRTDMDNDTDILVKFTRRYSLDLHLICEKSGCAPALLGFQRLPGGFYAIAMEYLKGAVPLSDSQDVEKNRTWVKLVKDVVARFHEQRFVHGDLRTPNIICGGERVAIIDFDWAGELGQTCYPLGQLNRELSAGRDSSKLQITIADDLRILDQTLRNVAT